MFFRTLVDKILVCPYLIISHCTKNKFTIKGFFSNCGGPTPQFPADLVTYTEEILTGKLHFLCSATIWISTIQNEVETWSRGTIWQKHCMKSVRNRSFSGPHFPVFELNTEKYEVSLIFLNAWKIRTRKTLNTDTFHAVKEPVDDVISLIT